MPCADLAVPPPTSPVIGAVMTLLNSAVKSFCPLESSNSAQGYHNKHKFVAIQGDLRLAICFIVMANALNIHFKYMYIFLFPQGISAWQRGPRTDAGSQLKEACGSSAVSVCCYILHF